MKKHQTKESGMVTSEIAIGFIPIMGAFLILMAAIALGNAALKAQDLAQSLARSIAVGMSPAKLLSSYEEEVPSSAVDVGTEGEYVVVTVTLEPTGVLTPFPMDVSSSAAALPEPGVTLP